MGGFFSGDCSWRYIIEKYLNPLLPMDWIHAFLSDDDNIDIAYNTVIGMFSQTWYDCMSEIMAALQVYVTTVL